MIVETRIHVLLWPCGCIADMEVCPPCAEDAEGFIAYQCPWCDAVVSGLDMKTWMIESEIDLPPLGTYRPLLQLGESIVEGGDNCDCGIPLVREREHGAKWFHLQVPIEHLVMLRN